MKSTSPIVAQRATDAMTRPRQMDRIAKSDGRTQRKTPQMRKYEITYLNSASEIEDLSRLAPALPAFEDAFGALGHGAILQTTTGPIAVEDLLPGDQIRVANGTHQTLLWRGSMTIKPGDDATSPDASSLIRITSDALGLDRPSPDLVLGPTARLYHKASGVRTLTGSRAAFIPARDFVDGNAFVELRPAAPVSVYQLGFESHQRLSVNGIEIESLHPGAAFTLGLRGEVLSQFLSLFPHKRSFDDFGTLQHPRLRLRDLDLFDVK